MALHTKYLIVIFNKKIDLRFQVHLNQMIGFAFGKILFNNLFVFANWMKLQRPIDYSTKKSKLLEDGNQTLG